MFNLKYFISHLKLIRMSETNLHFLNFFLLNKAIIFPVEK